MSFFLPGINNMNSLINFAGNYTSTVSDEARAIMEQQGTLINGLSIEDSLYSITNNALGDTRTYLDQFKQAHPDLPPYEPNTFTMPTTYNNSIGAAMDTLRGVQAQIDADPNFKGTPTAATLREERQLELDEEQNRINQELSANIGELAANTTGLTDILNDLVDNSNSTNNTLNTVSNTLNSIQQWLFNMEQQLAAQTAAAQAAADAAAQTAANTAATAAAAQATADAAEAEAAAAQAAADAAAAQAAADTAAATTTTTTV